VFLGCEESRREGLGWDYERLPSEAGFIAVKLANSGMAPHCGQQHAVVPVLKRARSRAPIGGEGRTTWRLPYGKARSQERTGR
jgi:hypothetical protein